jgi:hypothetical protein
MVAVQLKARIIGNHIDFRYSPTTSACEAGYWCSKYKKKQNYTGLCKTLFADWCCKIGGFVIIAFAYLNYLLQYSFCETILHLRIEQNMH